MGISVLDCTLRDGGYCNAWKFGKSNIAKIMNGLVEANIDIIECGFITSKVEYVDDTSRFTEVEQISKFIPKDKRGKNFVAMINYGEYDVDKIPKCDGTSIDGIRVAFHKKDRFDALHMCGKIKEKGYKVFIQGMVSLSYNDKEFLELIHAVNELEPYAFYIVDSFGQMKRKDLVRLLYLVEHNLKDTIRVGFHSHNNMQLAYSNAQSLVDFHTPKDIIIDASIYGMGRGAGNLNTELFVEFLNENANGVYSLKPLLTIIDEILNDFYKRSYWGYSLPNYLAAKHNIHPNYASYLDEKNTLTVEAMDDIFSMMETEKSYSYDKAYIETLYFKYMELGETNNSHLETFKETIREREILIIGPGKSSEAEWDVIEEFIVEKNPILISINFDYDLCDVDYIFVSNIRRFKGISRDKYAKCICTTNIPSLEVYLREQYRELLNDQGIVSDNAGMMLIQFLINIGVKKVNIVGMDGYSLDPDKNFLSDHMSFIAHKSTIDAMNEGMARVLSEYKKRIEINFVVSPYNLRL